MNAAGVDRILDRCRYYREVCAISAYMREGGIFMRVGAVGGVRMPSTLGVRVREKLPCRGPVVVEFDRQSRAWWTMLTGFAGPHLSECEMFALLAASEAMVIPLGHEVRLPVPRDPIFRWLVDKPVDAFRPSPDDVVDAVLACKAMPETG
ncbi:DNA-directed RNA polymerase subunit beta [Nocardia ninae]|uniref:Uncharacterized protein n=1 Tax=Nocardia ninae NBRC 108245 TaxID=1210091 RepID=A0A511MGV5_9NOCA|nr:DNA-directed RNA polymerase subunit beta [Nocardia ninae]GEM39923.1 hypothetical protein NN4_44420 [Nocardia ninae NBRC 108245]